MNLIGLKELEICVDASVSTRKGRTFTCSGAICINNNNEDYYILQDSTNNRGELLALYRGVLMAINEVQRNPTEYGKISIYSDSQFAVFGVTRWMHGWLKHMDENGIIYGTNNLPVKNQSIFMMIISLCVSNKLVVHFYNNLGHIDVNNKRQLYKAMYYFNDINKCNKTLDEIRTISIYNNIVDDRTRRAMHGIKTDSYPVIEYEHAPICPIRYYVAPGFGKYVK